MQTTKTWTEAEIAARRATGDALVTAPGWSHSTTTGTGIAGAILSSVRMEPYTYKTIERDERDGELFPSTEAAEAYSLSAGRLMWYRDSDAYKASVERRARILGVS